MTRQTVLVEYSLDSLGDVRPEAFEQACQRRAAARGFAVEFRIGLKNRETIDGEICDEIVERAFAECCSDSSSARIANVRYDRSNEMWIWDADGDGYFERSSAFISAVEHATGWPAAELRELIPAGTAHVFDA